MTQPDPAPEPPTADELGYAEALAELEGIVAELEREAVDVDHLSVRVRRAAELVTVLRQRIAGARLEVTKVVAELDEATSSDPSA